MQNLNFAIPIISHRRLLDGVPKVHHRLVLPLAFSKGQGVWFAAMVATDDQSDFSDHLEAYDLRADYKRCLLGPLREPHERAWQLVGSVSVGWASLPSLES